MVRPERSNGQWRRMASKFRFQVLVAFIVLLFVLGGASRSDVASTIVIRPLSVLFCAYALTMATRGDIRRIRMPLSLLAALAFYHGVQLVPLPPAIWHTLAGHMLVADNDRLIGLAETWRPISLSPSRTWNGLASLVVPAATLLLMAIQRGRRSTAIVLVLMGVAVVSACLGLLQVGSGGDAPLYLYRFTNPGRAVGLFANPNHHAFFLAATIILAAWYFASARGVSGSARGRQAIGIGVGGVSATVAMVCGTRTGFLLTIVALISGYALILLSRRGEVPRRRDKRQTRMRVWARYVPYVVLTTAGVLVFLFYERIPALSRLAAKNPVEDLRFQVLPTLLHMARGYLPFGSGFGSFEYVFKIFEPDAVLSSAYLNQAHDDFLQVVIEGGVPGLLLLLLALVSYVRRAPAAWRALRAPHQPPESRLPAAGLLAIGVLVLASATDYPLRTPSLMAFVAILVVLVLVPTEPTPRAKAVE